MLNNNKIRNDANETKEKSNLKKDQFILTRGVKIRKE